MSSFRPAAAARPAVTVIVRLIQFIPGTIVLIIPFPDHETRIIKVFVSAEPVGVLFRSVIKPVDLVVFLVRLVVSITLVFKQLIMKLRIILHLKELQPIHGILSL